MILLAIFLCKRNSALSKYRHRNWNDIIYIYKFILNKIASEKIIKLNSKLSLSLIKICMLAKKYKDLFKYVQNISGDEDVTYMKFQLAMASCYLNRYSESITFLDDLLTILLRNDNDFIQNKLISAISTDNLNNKMSSNNISIALVDLQNILTNNNKEIFLVSGTLLGYAREKNILSHDKDVDVGIFDHEDIKKTISFIENSNLFIIKILLIF